MGYYTRYQLSYKLTGTAKEDKAKIKFANECREKGIEIPESVQFQTESYEQKLIAALDNPSCTYGNLSQFINKNMDSCKWYDHEAEMIAFSKEWPDVIFTLKGDGEEQGDSWVKYFKGGKMQIALAQIAYEDFNEKKLK